MTRGIFVTGTGTDVGKTVVAALTCRALGRSGRACRYVKPVQTGDPGGSASPDAALVAAITRGLPVTTTTVYRFPLPASPHLASERAGVRIEIERILESCAASGDELVVGEGAGGPFVPLDRQGLLVADIPVRAGFPVVLTGPAALGAINSTCLAHRFLVERGAKVNAILLRAAQDRPDDIENDNCGTIREITRCRFVETFPSSTPGMIRNSRFFPVDTILGWFDE
jgi:dethiobiotin synthetase